METAITVSAESKPTQMSNMTPAQIELIKKTIAKSATNDELHLFLYQCNRLGLDPLSKQAYFVKYGNGPGTVIIGIDGFRIAAARTGKLTGIKRGAIRDDDGVLIGGWAEVYRSDWAHCAREEVPLSEYCKATPNWRDMPETMIKKVAECAALRMAFPSDLSGIYSHEEMEQAIPIAPPPQDPIISRGLDVVEKAMGINQSGYVCSFGKFKGMAIADVPSDELSNYVTWLQDKAKRENKPIQGIVKDFIEAAEFQINGGDIK
jgi:phage recombination protein Bet